MRSSEKRHSAPVHKVLIMAGGTGGHIFPGLAVAELLQAQGWKICWLGSKDRMEAHLVPQHGYPIGFIDVAGVRGNGLRRKLLAPFMVLRCVFQALRVLHREKPDVVLGFGGFASGPGGIAAWLMSKPLVLHEQNSVAGFTNRTLAYFASRVLMAFPGTFALRHEAQLVGNPLRPSIAALVQKNQLAKAAGEQKTANDKPLNVLILGGSLGARALNQNIPALLAQTSVANDICLWHQTGRDNKAAVEAIYQRDLASNQNIRIDEFIDDMSEAYQWADVAICRSGALTVAEIAAAGITALFVPLPSAVDDHQSGNARWLADSNAALVVAQEALLSGEFMVEIDQLLSDKARLRSMGDNARKMAITDAADRVAAVCKSLVSPG